MLKVENALKIYRTAIMVVERSVWVRTSTRPTNSPRPYSPTNSFFPVGNWTTDLNRPFKMRYTQSECSPCLHREEERKKITDVQQSKNSQDHYAQIYSNHEDAKSANPEPVQGASSFDQHPVECEINLPHKARHSLNDRVTDIQNNLRLLFHDPTLKTSHSHHHTSIIHKHISTIITIIKGSLQN